MKVLFISEYIDEKGQGAYELARAHYNSLCAVAGSANVDLISIRLSKAEKSELGGDFYVGFHSKIDILSNLIHGYPTFYNASLEKLILDKMKKNQYDAVFFDNSYYGRIIKKIKKCFPKVPVVVFYVGVKANSGRQTVKNRHYKLNIILMVRNNIREEKLTVKFADVHVLLNNRDSEELNKYYNRKADYLLPIYYIDRAQIEPVQPTENEFRILFLGGNFWPNILGITWFAENVMPRIKKQGKLFVVGRGMEVLREKSAFQNKSNIEVIGGVEDLSYWYNSSDVVVGPIFHGEGMKTKTAEALMYGKRYIGSAEALCGYVGLDQYHCETADEFVKMINDYIDTGVPRYDPDMRKLYEEHYSIEAGNKTICDILRGIDNHE